MADQLISADPHWSGTAGADVPPLMPHPEARLSAAAPPLVVGGREYPSALPGDPEPRVTLEDLRDHPVDSLQRIGTTLKKDVSDPRLWLTLAASYFAPKMFNYAAPIVARAANAAASTAGRVSINPSVAMDEFSLIKPQKMLKAVSLKEQPVADRVPGFDRYLPNASGAPAPSSAASPPPTSPVAVAPAGTAAPVADTPPPPPATASPVSPAPAPASHPLWDEPGRTLDLPMAQRTKGQQSASWLQSDLGIAARRQGVTLSRAESTAAETLMRDHGVSANEAMQTVRQLQAARTPSGLTLSPEEATQFEALKQQGQSGAQAEAAILKLRTLAKTLKTPASETVTDAVRRRNQTGRWDE